MGAGGAVGWWSARPGGWSGGSFRRAGPQPGFRPQGPGSLRALGRLGPFFPSALRCKRRGSALWKPLVRRGESATISAVSPRAKPCACDRHTRPLDPLPLGNW